VDKYKRRYQSHSSLQFKRRIILLGSWNARVARRDYSSDLVI